MSYDKSTDRNRRAAKEWRADQAFSQGNDCQGNKNKSFHSFDPHSPDSLHGCAVTGCGEMISRRLLMCLAHWRMVPAPLRRAVSDTYHSGGAGAYLAARKAAIESVAEGRL